ncbi:MAG: adenosine monophosphate-protein transferase [Spirochaetaceae bacterium]|nr:MAG: adenosine monophosphate-protein transferase [Spirochaetaceae bacterium]
MDFQTVPVKLPEDCNIIVGQSHFIKTVEDISEIVISSVPGAKFGIAFCEASGPCLVRTEGNDTALITAATATAQAVAAGHTFYLFLKNAFPINMLTQIKLCQEVARIFCATANPLQIITAGTEQGRGIIGVIDGASPKGIETESDKKARYDLLRKFGYKY